jgi:hypothetical protein
MTEIHDLTVREIASLTAEYERQRQAYIAEKIELEASGAAEEVLTDFQATVREHAANLLNGHAPSDLKSLRMMPRVQEINVELGAIGLILEVLQKKELLQEAIEAADWVIANGTQSRALCRDLILTGERLRALEERALAMRAELRGQVPATLELAAFVGNGRSPLAIPWSTDPLSRMRTAALKAEIITEKDLKEARNA